jgi:transposase-like protein
MNCPNDNTPMLGSDRAGFVCPKCGYTYNPHDDRPLPGDPTPSPAT